MSQALAATLGALASATLLAGSAGASQIESDELVVFFPTYGHLADDGSAWWLPIHGWIYEPEESSVKRAIALAGFRRALGISADRAQLALFNERLRAFLVDNESGKQVSLRLGDRAHVMHESNDDGHFHGLVELPVGEAESLLADPEAKGRRIEFAAVTAAGDDRRFAGAVELVSATGLSVISDIDDTIKISNVTDRKALIANTFLRPFQAVPGMADLYRRWAEAGASFHYVSASPWQMYVPLDKFREEAGFPAGSFHLKLFRLSDRPVRNLIGPHDEYKRGAIEPILRAFPERRFILVGDNGERDPQIYGQLAREYPEQIVFVLIRNVTDEAADSQRFRVAFDQVPPERWRIFKDPAELAEIEIPTAVER